MKVNIFDTDACYDVIYADPPWQQAKGGRKAKRPNSSGTALDYPVARKLELYARNTRGGWDCWGNEV